MHEGSFIKEPKTDQIIFDMIVRSELDASANDGDADCLLSSDIESFRAGLIVNLSDVPS